MEGFPGDGTLFSSGGAGSTNPDWGFHTVRGGIDPGDHRFRLRFVGVVEVLEGFPNRGWCLILPEKQLLPRAPRPVIGQGRTGGRPRPIELGLGKHWIKVNADYIASARIDALRTPYFTLLACAKRRS